MLRITRTCAGLKSSCSEISSPMRSSAVPSLAQTWWACALSWTISTGGQAADSFVRQP
jgi:hypothetical protein